MAILNYLIAVGVVLASFACQPNKDVGSEPQATKEKHTWDLNPRVDIYGKRVGVESFQGKVNVVFVSNVADRIKGAAMAEDVLTQFAKHKKLNAIFILDGRTLTWYVKGLISSIGSTVEEQIQITAADAFKKAMQIPSNNRWYQSTEEIKSSLHFVVDAKGELIDASGLIPKALSASLVDPSTGKQLLVHNRPAVMRLVDFEKRNSVYREFIKNVNDALLGADAEIAER